MSAQHATHWSQVDNPLTRHLPKYETLAELANVLMCNPLRGLDVKMLSVPERMQLLQGDKQPLTPTMTSLKAAGTILAMHRAFLALRNPTLSDGRRMVDGALANGLSGQDYLHMPAVPGSCLLLIKGITGTAKTVAVKRTLIGLGPQVIHHGEEPSALWKSAVQVTWLFVPMSHDGSRGGLLNSILLALDTQLGTDHAASLPRQHKSVERLVGAVIALLHSVYLGALVIDEIQVMNLVRSEQASKMQLFLLSLSNSGIPLVLVGNPGGFSWINEFSQTLSRSVEREEIFFHPSGAVGPPEDDDWNDVFEGIRNYYLLDDPPREIGRCSLVLRRCSGGIARVALALWTGAQLNVLLDGGGQLTAEDIEDRYRAESFDVIRPLCDGFANRDPILLERFAADVPVDYYARVWQKSIAPAGAAIDHQRQMTLPGKSTERVPASKTGRTAAASFAGSETRRKSQQKRREQLVETLAPEDMRIDGLKRHSLASLDALMASVDDDENSRKKD